MSRNVVATPLLRTLIWPLCWTTKIRFVPSWAPVAKIALLKPPIGAPRVIALTGLGAGVGLGVGTGFLVGTGVAPGVGFAPEDGELPADPAGAREPDPPGPESP